MALCHPTSRRSLACSMSLHGAIGERKQARHETNLAELWGNLNAESAGLRLGSGNSRTPALTERAQCRWWWLEIAGWERYLRLRGLVTNGIIRTSDGSRRFLAMRVGLYIDGFNLYYGGRSVCGRSTPGWRWLDLRALGTTLIAASTQWTARKAVLHRVVYCTAYIDGAVNPSGNQDQTAYVNALRRSKSFDHLEVGKFISAVRARPLATRDLKGRPTIAEADWPIKVKDAGGQDVPKARFVASYMHVEEKGSDVNVASHLLADVLLGEVDAAILISNDSDLRYPVQLARTKVPVGTVNPSTSHTAGDLKGARTDGVSDHWWRKLTKADYTNCQLPNPCHSIPRPQGW